MSRISSPADYVYTGVIIEIKKREVELALEMLSLTDYWSITDGQRDMQRRIIELRMVDPFSLDAGGSSLYVIDPTVIYCTFS